MAFSVACVPANDPHFANAVRVIVEFVQVDEPPRAPGVRVWEGALHRGFGYNSAAIRVRRIHGETTVTFYREGVGRAAMSSVAPREKTA